MEPKEKLEEMITSAVNEKLVDVNKEKEELTSKVDALKSEVEEMKKITVEKEAADKPWETLGTYMSAIKDSATSGKLDPRLRSAAGDGQTMKVGSEGGFLVPEQFANLGDITKDRAHLASHCTNVPLDVPSISYNYFDGFDESGGLVGGGLRWYHVEEEGEGTITKAKWGKCRLELRKLMGVTQASGEILKFSPSSIEGILTSGMDSSLALTIDNILVNGSGSTEGLGFLNAPCKIAIAAEGSQTADTVVLSNIVKMSARFKGDRGIWVASRMVEPQLALMTLGNQPMYIPAGSMTANPGFGMLYGRPIVFCDACPVLGDAGDITLVDMSMMHFGTAAGAGVDYAASSEVLFLKDINVFRYIYYYDSIHTWKSAFTPKKGDSRSCIVTVADRA